MLINNKIKYHKYIFFISYQKNKFTDWDLKSKGTFGLAEM